MYIMTLTKLFSHQGMKGVKGEHGVPGEPVSFFVKNIILFKLRLGITFNTTK